MQWGQPQPPAMTKATSNIGANGDPLNPQQCVILELLAHFSRPSVCSHPRIVHLIKET